MNIPAPKLTLSEIRNARLAIEAAQKTAADERQRSLDRTHNTLLFVLAENVKGIAGYMPHIQDGKLTIFAQREGGDAVATTWKLDRDGITSDRLSAMEQRITTAEINEALEHTDWALQQFERERMTKHLRVASGSGARSSQ